MFISNFSCVLLPLLLLLWNKNHCYATTSEPNTKESYTTEWPVFGYNKRECHLDSVGIPVKHAHSQFSEVGNWMRDAMPADEEMKDRRWVIDGYASGLLHEYENEEDLMLKQQRIKYYTDYLASGTGGVVFNGSYIYHRRGSAFIVKYDLETAELSQLELPLLSHLDCAIDEDYAFVKCNHTDRDSYLYDQPHNYVDLAVDENGLWAVYLSQELGLTVSKLDFDNLNIVKTWHIDEVNGTQIANTYIMCGVLYALQYGSVQNSKVSFAYDLYRDEGSTLDVQWFNPYEKLSMLDYCPYDSRVYFYDDGNLLSVNIRVTDDKV